MNSGQLMSENLFSEGLSLMLLGMGTVFVFLTILVIVTTIMSSLVQKYAPEEPTGKGQSGATAELTDQTLLAVISAAIHVHRSRQKKN